MKAVSALMIAVLIWLAGLWAFVTRVEQSTPAPEPEVHDGIVALTGSSVRRLAAATELLEEGKGKRLLVSGVNRQASRADILDVTKAGKKVYDCCVDLGFMAADTVGNAQETAEWARAKGYESLIVVTADFHMPRAMLELRAAMPDAKALEGALQAAGVDATLDDHRLWISDIERSAGVARWAAIAVFLLIAAAAAAVIGFATRAGLAAHHETIEVLHLYGARHSFISRLFQLRFARTAALAGLFGAIGAAIIGAVARLAGGGAGLTPVLPVAWTDLAWLAPAPLLAAGVAALAAWRTAEALLKGMR